MENVPEYSAKMITMYNIKSMLMNPMTKNTIFILLLEITASIPGYMRLI